MLGDLVPVIVIDHFLGGLAADQLLEYAITRESGFRPSKVALRDEGIIDQSRRVSKVNSDIDAAMPLIEPAIRKAVDEAIPKLGLVNVESYSLEPELTWCGNGGFFKTHVDTLYRDRPANQRVMTVVYYFYKEPKAFTGGQLRLYGLGSDANSPGPREIEPLLDRAVLFPAWFPHEVLPVDSSSHAFADGRFAISCWVRRIFGGDQYYGNHYGSQRH
jgi:Rps23 Pro-64 3,4-dihydroxylase Tpa1-like proline 4-hydroxylase